jgi:ATP-dependent Zn protease
MESQKPPQKTGISPIWWLIMVGLLAWNLYSFWPRPQSQVSLPYSSFVDQVKAEHVKAVQISGSSIKGEFSQPQPLGDLVPVPTAAPGATPVATETVTYTLFTTTFPEVVGDSSLMPLLNLHNVEVLVSPPASPWFTILLTDGLPI